MSRFDAIQMCDLEIRKKVQPKHEIPKSSFVAHCRTHKEITNTRLLPRLDIIVTCCRDTALNRTAHVSLSINLDNAAYMLDTLVIIIK